MANKIIIGILTFLLGINIACKKGTTNPVSNNDDDVTPPPIENVIDSDAEAIDLFKQYTHTNITPTNGIFNFIMSNKMYQQSFFARMDNLNGSLKTPGNEVYLSRKNPTNVSLNQAIKYINNSDIHYFTFTGWVGKRCYNITFGLTTNQTRDVITNYNKLLKDPHLD